MRAVRAGWGVSVLPELQVRDLLRAGALVDLMPGQALQVGLYWHCWNLDSAVLDALTHALQTAAGIVLTRMTTA